MEPTTILMTLALAFGPQTPAKPVPIGGDDFFTGLGQTVVKKDAAAWRRDIARAQLLFEVDGKVQAARDDVMKTWEALTRSESFEGRVDVALDTLQLASQILARIGDWTAAETMLARTGQGVLGKELAAVANDRRFVAAREFPERARRAFQRAGPSSDANQIDSAVIEALRAGNSSVLAELGAAAAPTYERLVRQSPEEYKPIEADPLVHLVRHAPERASILSRELLSRPELEFLVAKRVIRAMENVDPSPTVNPKPTIFSPRSDVWRFTQDNGQNEPPALGDTTWREVVTLLLRIPVAARDALAFVRQLAEFDALDAPLRAALVDVARSDDQALVRALASVLDGIGQRSTVDPLLVELLEVPAADVRAAAAKALSRLHRSEPLLGKVADPDPRVRSWVAAGLQPATIKEVQYFNINRQTYPPAKSIEREFDVRDRGLVDRLLADADPGVRTAALAVASKAGIRLTPELAGRLMRDPDAEVRRSAVGLLPTNANEAAPLLERAHTDSDSRVRMAVQQEIAEHYGFGFRRAERPGATLRALAVAHLVPGAPDPQNNFEPFRRNLLTQLLEDADDTRALVKAFLASPPLPRLSTQELWNNLRSREKGEPGSLRFLDAESVRALLVRAHSEKRSVEVVGAGLDRTERPPAVTAGIAAFVADPAMSRRWRLGLWNYVAQDPQAEQLLVTALTNPPFDPKAVEPDELAVIDNLKNPGEPKTVLSGVLTKLLDARVPDAVLARLAARAIEQGDPPLAISKELYGRLAKSKEEVSFFVLSWAVQREAERGRWEPARIALDDPELLSAALIALGRRRPPEGLAWLGAHLHDPTWSRKSGTGAAAAIAGYLSEEAAEILLRGAELAPTPEVRKACLDGVAEIRAFLDQKASWQQRTTGAQQRDAAVAELAAMLDSKDPAQRAEAARGLATLQGVEHLPRLVRMLQDPDAKVRAAVQESLGRLNAPR